MYINKTLCKYFDIEKKGYVTVGDIMSRRFIFSAAVVLFLGLLYCIYRGILDIIAIMDGTFDPSTLPGIHLLAGAMGVVWILGYISIMRGQYRRVDDKSAVLLSGADLTPI